MQTMSFRGAWIALLTFSFSGVSAHGLDLEQPKKNGDEKKKAVLSVPNGAMNNQKLQQILQVFTSIEDGGPGSWNVIFEGRTLLIVTDEAHNRMRIMTPIIEAADLSKEDLVILMKANFQSALDARYAIFKDFVWSVYIHSLAELSGEQALNAMRQVKQLADTYGSSYSSTDVILNAQ